MLDRLVALVSRVVHDNKELIRTRIAEESPWWVPEVVDDKLYQKIVAGIERTLERRGGERRRIRCAGSSTTRCATSPTSCTTRPR